LEYIHWEQCDGTAFQIVSFLKKPNLKKVDWGTSEEYVMTVDGVNIFSVIWKDNKTVILLFTLASKITVRQVVRYDSRNKERVTVECPEIIKLYNKHMGSVD
jgi:hypothetical protein